MNYESTCRSNYFKVKDMQAFKESSCSGISFEHDQQGNVAIFADEGWPTERWSENPEDPDGPGLEEPWDVVEWLSCHLAVGEVALCMEAGHEGQRYVVGHAFIVGWDGKTAYINLADWAKWKAKAMYGPQFDLQPAEL